MDKIKLRAFDGIAFTGFLILPMLFYTGLGRLTRENLAGVWIAMLIAFIIILSIFLITSSLMKRYETKNIIEITSIVLGRPIGYIYAVVLSLYFCYFTGVHIRETAEILKIYGFILTPLYIIVGLIILVAVVMNFFGGRAIIKSAGFFFIIILVGIVFVVLVGLNRYNPDNLVPVLGSGMPDIIKNSIFMTSLFDGVMILFLFAPAFSSATSMKKTGVITIVLSTAIFILLNLCYVMMFSPTVASTLMSGFMEIGKSSYYNHFFYRFESILLFVLIFSSLMLASIGLYISKESIVQSFHMKSSKVLIVICIMLIIATALIPANIHDLMRIYLPLIRQYSAFFIVGFPLLVWLISSLKRMFKYEKN